MQSHSTEDAMKNIESTRKSMNGLVTSRSESSLKHVDKTLSDLGTSVERYAESLKNTQKFISSTRKSADKFNTSASLLLSMGRQPVAAVDAGRECRVNDRPGSY